MVKTKEELTAAAEHAFKEELKKAYLFLSGLPWEDKRLRPYMIMDSNLFRPLLNQNHFSGSLMTVQAAEWYAKSLALARYNGNTSGNLGIPRRGDTSLHDLGEPDEDDFIPNEDEAEYLFGYKREVTHKEDKPELKSLSAADFIQVMKILIDEHEKLPEGKWNTTAKMNYWKRVDERVHKIEGLDGIPISIEMRWIKRHLKKDQRMGTKTDSNHFPAGKEVRDLLDHFLFLEDAKEKHSLPPAREPKRPLNLEQFILLMGILIDEGLMVNEIRPDKLRNVCKIFEAHTGLSMKSLPSVLTQDLIKRRAGKSAWPKTARANQELVERYDSLLDQYLANAKAEKSQSSTTARESHQYKGPPERKHSPTGLHPRHHASAQLPSFPAGGAKTTQQQTTVEAERDKLARFREYCKQYLHEHAVAYENIVSERRRELFDVAKNIQDAVDNLCQRIHKQVEDGDTSLSEAMKQAHTILNLASKPRKSEIFPHDVPHTTADKRRGHPSVTKTTSCDVEISPELRSIGLHDDQIAQPSDWLLTGGVSDSVRRSPVLNVQSGQQSAPRASQRSGQHLRQSSRSARSSTRLSPKAPSQAPSRSASEHSDLYNATPPPPAAASEPDQAPTISMTNVAEEFTYIDPLTGLPYDFGIDPLDLASGDEAPQFFSDEYEAPHLILPSSGPVNRMLDDAIRNYKSPGASPKPGSKHPRSPSKSDGSNFEMQDVGNEVSEIEKSSSSGLTPSPRSGEKPRSPKPTGKSPDARDQRAPSESIRVSPSKSGEPKSPLLVGGLSSRADSTSKHHSGKHLERPHALGAPQKPASTEDHTGTLKVPLQPTTSRSGQQSGSGSSSSGAATAAKTTKSTSKDKHSPPSKDDRASKRPKQSDKKG